MKRNTTLQTFALVAAGLVILTACGSDEGDPSAGGAATGTQAEEEPQGSQTTGEDTADDPQAAGCGTEDDWAAVEAAAEDEGQVAWYVGLPPDVVDNLAEEFETAYPGISVQVTRQASGALIQRFRSEADAGAVTADVLTVASKPFVSDAGQEGLTIELADGSLPALEGIGEDFKGQHYVQATLIPWGIEYNTDLVTESVSSYEDLLRPEFEGSVVLTDPRPGGAVAGNVNYLYNQYGEDFLRELGPQVSQVVDSISQGIQLVAAGEAKAVIQSVPGVNDELVAGGAPVELVIPDETSAFGHYLAIPDGSPNPNAACVLANWLLDDDAQSLLGSAVGPAIRESAQSEDAIQLPSDFQMVDVAEAESRTDEFAELLGL